MCALQEVDKYNRQTFAAVKKRLVVWSKISWNYRSDSQNMSRATHSCLSVAHTSFNLAEYNTGCRGCLWLFVWLSIFLTRIFLFLEGACMIYWCVFHLRTTLTTDSNNKTDDWWTMRWYLDLPSPDWGSTDISGWKYRDPKRGRPEPEPEPRAGICGTWPSSPFPPQPANNRVWYYIWHINQAGSCSYTIKTEFVHIPYFKFDMYAIPFEFIVHVEKEERHNPHREERCLGGSKNWRFDPGETSLCPLWNQKSALIYLSRNFCTLETILP